MILTGNDLVEIRSIFREELDSEIHPIKGDLEAMKNDIKDIYRMISDLQHSAITDRKFRKLSVERKLLTINEELLDTARQARVTLPI